MSYVQQLCRTPACRYPQNPSLKVSKGSTHERRQNRAGWWTAAGARASQLCTVAPPVQSLADESAVYAQVVRAGAVVVVLDAAGRAGAVAGRRNVLADADALLLVQQTRSGQGALQLLRLDDERSSQALYHERQRG